MLLKFMSVMPMLWVAHQRPPVRHRLQQFERLHFSWLDYPLVFRELAPNAQNTGCLKKKILTTCSATARNCPEASPLTATKRSS